MNTVLQKVIEMSLYGSIAILIVMLFRLVFRKYSKKLTLLFWVIVAFRLLCPFNFDSHLSIMNLIPAEVEEKTEIHQTLLSDNDHSVVHTKDAVTDKVKIIPDKNAVSENKTVSNEAAASKQNITLDREDILCIVWVGGIIVMLSYAGYKYVKVKRFVKRCIRSSDGKFLETDKTDTPFVTGIFKTQICIPSHIKNEEKEYLLLHEQIHIKNHDGFIKMAGFLIVCLHWFNPLVWLAYALFCSDLEMRCDEEVVEKLGQDIKKEYCRSIVLHSVKEPFGLARTAFSGLGLGSMEVKMRIKNLLNYRKVSKTSAALILGLTIGTTAVLSACAVAEDPAHAALSMDESVDVSEETIEEETSESVDDTEISDETDVSDETSVSEETDTDIPSEIVVGSDEEIVQNDAPNFVLDTSYDYSDDAGLCKWAETIIEDGTEYQGALTMTIDPNGDGNLVESRVLYFKIGNQAILMSRPADPNFPYEVESLLWYSSIADECDLYYGPDDGNEGDYALEFNRDTYDWPAQGHLYGEDGILVVVVNDASILPPYTVN
ncbi:MAG: hypothetical protein J6U54_03285 [Clostridiales bacterium]|nr:hypothetical protein [Clostridiales bacterium]